MKLKDIHNSRKLIIEDNLLNNLLRKVIEHYPNEFGGFLIGYYSSDFKTLFVKDFLLPQKYQGLLSIFERSIDGIKNIFYQIFKIKGQYYIGEWHSHPNGGTMYSQTDLHAMIKIAEEETVRIKNPILLILSVNPNSKTTIAFYLYDNKKLIKYEPDKY
ncbi:hypothetical protein EZS27_020696 [termite gut metagenome]|uniref:JAB domain-containing protein n=1 Tax=termite gut metagenome TaxID=433724 RepID=A0A5J4RD06_9ZZZZ